MKGQFSLQGRNEVADKVIDVSVNVDASDKIISVNSYSSQRETSSTEGSILQLVKSGDARILLATSTCE